MLVGINHFVFQKDVALPTPPSLDEDAFGVVSGGSSHLPHDLFCFTLFALKEELFPYISVKNFILKYSQDFFPLDYVELKHQSN